jgi:hypothetical protein
MLKSRLQGCNNRQDLITLRHSKRPAWQKIMLNIYQK